MLFIFFAILCRKFKPYGSSAYKVACYFVIFALTVRLYVLYMQINKRLWLAYLEM